MYREDSEQPAHASSGPIALSMMLLLGFLLFLIFVSGGFFLYVVFGVIAIFFVGLLHYLTWGASLHQRTEADREEERLREELEDRRW